MELPDGGGVCGLDHLSSAAAQEMSYGQAEYLNSCAVCHGVDAKGDGPLRALLSEPPNDLNSLRRATAGRFPIQGSSRRSTVATRYQVMVSARCLSGAVSFSRRMPRPTATVAARWSPRNASTTSPATSRRCSIKIGGFRRPRMAPCAKGQAHFPGRSTVRLGVQAPEREALVLNPAELPSSSFAVIGNAQPRIGLNGRAGLVRLSAVPARNVSAIRGRPAVRIPPLASPRDLPDATVRIGRGGTRATKKESRQAPKRPR